MFTIQLLAILLLSQLLGGLAQRIGQCRVVGEITAGILLGPTFLQPLLQSMGVQSSLFAAEHIGWIGTLAELALVLLMFEVGMHIAPDNGRHSRQENQAALKIAAAGLVLPFIAGTIVAWYAHPVLAPSFDQWSFIVFCGIALAVSALPVMIRIVEDLGISDLPAVALTLRAAVLTDIAGWLALGAVIVFSAFHHDLKLVALFGFCLLLGVASYVALSLQWVERVLAKAEADEYPRHLPWVLCYLLASAWITMHLQLHAGIGALLAGAMISRAPGFASYWNRQIGGFLRIFLLPVFFASAGLKTSLSTAGNALELKWLLIFLVAAFVSKFFGAYLGARRSGFSYQDSTLTGGLMNTRGLMELVVLSIGLELQLISPTVYSLLVTVALIVTATTTPLVRRVTQRAPRAFARPAIAEKNFN
ncbi:cation:proton antiporter [Pseudomonas piscis]|uniref:cation:proton antiporter n=1 Tax=Pseudomonas piscis TaxID=2614538 RepID=UPI0003B45CB9|nr:cation:proton antiporter [Pseudomonas piscis]ERO64358.1 hypothetical protein P308_24150 [Pseudomonas piscis]